MVYAIDPLTNRAISPKELFKWVGEFYYKKYSPPFVLNWCPNVPAVLHAFPAVSLYPLSIQWVSKCVVSQAPPLGFFLCNVSVFSLPSLSLLWLSCRGTESVICHRKGEDIREKKGWVKLGKDTVKQGAFQSVHQPVMPVPERLFQELGYIPVIHFISFVWGHRDRQDVCVLNPCLTNERPCSHAIKATQKKGLARHFFILSEEKRPWP